MDFEDEDERREQAERLKELQDQLAKVVDGRQRRQRILNDLLLCAKRLRPTRAKAKATAPTT